MLQSTGDFDRMASSRIGMLHMLSGIDAPVVGLQDVLTPNLAFALSYAGPCGSEIRAIRSGAFGDVVNLLGKLALYASA